MMQMKIEIVTLFTLIAVIIASVLPFARAEELITTPLDELLPSREDIPTEYRTGSSENLTLTDPGFIEGKEVNYVKLGVGYTIDLHVSFQVYRFSDIDSANTYYYKKVNDIKSEGGYTEVLIPGAFAATYPYGRADSWGVISNIVFSVRLFSEYSWEDMTKELKDFTNQEASIVPEFSSFLVSPLFMISTLLAVIVYRRRVSIRLGAETQTIR